MLLTEFLSDQEGKNVPKCSGYRSKDELILLE